MDLDDWIRKEYLDDPGYVADECLAIAARASMLNDTLRMLIAKSIAATASEKSNPGLAYKLHDSIANSYAELAYSAEDSGSNAGPKHENEAVKFFSLAYDHKIASARLTEEDDDEHTAFSFFYAGAWARHIADLTRSRTWLKRALHCYRNVLSYVQVPSLACLKGKAKNEIEYCKRWIKNIGAFKNIPKHKVLHRLQPKEQYKVLGKMLRKIH